MGDNPMIYPEDGNYFIGQIMKKTMRFFGIYGGSKPAIHGKKLMEQSHQFMNIS
jgi:hypothetical protein